MIDYSLSILPALLSGAQMTLAVFGLTIIGAIPLGLLLSLVLLAKFKPLHYLLDLYVWLMRGTPLLLQLIFVFYGLPVVGIVFNRFDAALIAFILNYAAYFAEIFRGGFQAVDNGQIEAAEVLGLTYPQTIAKIIVPQTVKIVLPSVGNEVINLIKDSSLVYVIGIGDLLRAGNVASARDVNLLPLLLVGIIYLLLTAICTWALRRLERYYRYYR
ncbi:amino ABC transporter, permease, 3-TM region, His/Glu/Gln/Arg/opine family domain protein [Latilactobacillus curvatus CRL 705]|uniref:amino acid ABC transporter permease n=1 Tax=Latilactobacillus curvatus TaxID=28038 RepID=UPI000230F57A|nr:amino acid ABC transporter permease [Latilactobacillus curvatus]EHE85646.1 amino ABC transporter, permease, 3-TM region, His/Glu/Gln/Arg/opine family domain protein [Latilactobacillus curvatus CRL 705]